jgi:NitT/TauT family transport system substrate-binding protein
MLSYLLAPFRHALAVCALIVGLAIVPAAAQTKVSLALDWIIGGTHAPYFVALDRGMYRDAGLDVSISRGFGSGDTVKRVGSGTADVGVADISTIITAMANEKIPVKVVGMMYDRATLGLIFLKESGINQPKDLEGRSLGRSASGASVTMLPAFLNANNVDRSKITEVVVDAATYMPLLMSGRVQAVLEQSIHLSKFQRVAAQQGKSAAAMRYSDFGLTAYGNAIIVSNNTAANKADMVKRFIEATLRGYAWALENPDEAVKIIMRSNPELDAAATKGELQALADIQNSPDIAKNGLSYINKEKMTTTRDTVTKALKLKRVVPIEEIYTTEFLPATPVNVKLGR